MLTPLSANEIEILDHHLSTLRMHLEEVANLVESRLSKTNDLAREARTVQHSFEEFASRIHSQAAGTTHAA
jgi:hypothetical protein